LEELISLFQPPAPLHLHLPFPPLLPLISLEFLEVPAAPPDLSLLLALCLRQEVWDWSGGKVRMRVTGVSLGFWWNSSSWVD
jgi:hypothetical protein